MYGEAAADQDQDGDRLVTALQKERAATAAETLGTTVKNIYNSMDATVDVTE